MRVTGRQNNGKTRPTAARCPDRYRFIEPGLARHGFFDFNPKSYTCSQPARRSGGGDIKTKLVVVRSSVSSLILRTSFFSDSERSSFRTNVVYAFADHRPRPADRHDPIRVLSPIKKCSKIIHLRHRYHRSTVNTV